MPEGYTAPKKLSQEELAALEQLGMTGGDTDGTFAIRPIEEMPLDGLAAACRALIMDENQFPQLLDTDADFARARALVEEKSDGEIHAELVYHYKAILATADEYEQKDYWLMNRATIQALVETIEQSTRITEALQGKE